MATKFPSRLADVIMNVNCVAWNPASMGRLATTGVGIIYTSSLSRSRRRLRDCETQGVRLLERAEVSDSYPEAC